MQTLIQSWAVKLSKSSQSYEVSSLPFWAVVPRYHLHQALEDTVTNCVTLSVENGQQQSESYTIKATMLTAGYCVGLKLWHTNRCQEFRDIQIG